MLLVEYRLEKEVTIENNPKRNFDFQMVGLLIIELQSPMCLGGRTTAIRNLDI